MCFTNVLLDINNVAQGLGNFTILLKLAHVPGGFDKIFLKPHNHALKEPAGETEM